jgi:malonate-semialdehyde dehydrogenase (acetylating) / methylmalonate-semialdehyde dehydrogenase
MPIQGQLPDYIQGQWRTSSATEFLPVQNPATAEVLAETPLGSAPDANAAVEAAAAAYPEWRRTPPQDRIQYLFKLKQLFEDHFDELARLITIENGKTLGEARAEVRRCIENIEVGCGIPTLMQGYNLEDVARGIDEIMIRQPLGVVVAITPFNFPMMVPRAAIPLC